jgi:flagellar hook-associated protein 2
MGVGSGIDIKELAKNLVEAEKTPRKDAIDAKIKKSEARISGLSLVNYSLTEIKKAFANLNDASDFTSLTATNSQSSAFAVTTDSSAQAGNYSINVSQIATAQRSPSGAFAARDTTLNSGAAFDLSLTVGTGSAQTINVTTATPAGVVSAINGAELGVTAQLLNTGDAAKPYTIVVTGQTGTSNSFTLTSTPAVTELNFGNATAGATTPPLSNLQNAGNATFTVDGLPISRSSNSISDVIAGVSLELYTPTTGNARIDLNRDSSGIEEKLTALVTAYNDFMDNMKILGDTSSDVETYGGALAGDSFLSSIKAQVRNLVMGNSSTPGTSLKAARDVGIDIDRYGKMSLDTTKLESALKNNFADVVKVFSADTNNQSIYSPLPGGVAGDGLKKLDAMLRSDGSIAIQTKNTNTLIEKQKADLTKLEARMEKLLARYTRQFSAMDSIVGSINGQRTSLESSMEGLMAMYTKG